MSKVPEYTVKESVRAKTVRLKMTAYDGLVVVVPKGFDQSRVPSLLKRNKQWLEKVSAQVEEQRKFYASEFADKVPERIALQAIGEEWGVGYHPTVAPWVRVEGLEGNRLAVYGDTDDVELCKNALRGWLNDMAHGHLVPWLRRMADEEGFECKRVIVRRQKTRWGSCSSQKTISINYKLLFMPSDLVQYVFMHELCHTVCLNHSSRFWSLVEKNVPDFREREFRLRSAWQHIPVWVDC